MKLRPSLRRYDAALERYSRALALARARGARTGAAADAAAAAKLLANRAACHLELRGFDAAVADCSDALELDPTYAKALLRRARARLALGDARELAGEVVMSSSPKHMTS